MRQEPGGHRGDQEVNCTTIYFKNSELKISLNIINKREQQLTIRVVHEHGARIGAIGEVVNC